MGSLLMPPWTVTQLSPDGVEMAGHFSRFHVGGNYAVHGGVLPLLFDHVFGMVLARRGAPDQPDGVPARRLPQRHPDRHSVDGARTGHQHRGPQGVRLRRIGRRDDTVLAEGTGLMVRLLPGQP